MAELNLAYDLSMYENAAENPTPRKEQKKSKVINAKTKFSIVRRIAGALSIAVTLSLIIGIIATNAAIAGYSAKIASNNAEIAKIESDIDYLNFTLENRMSLEEIEIHAVSELGMVKMDSTQKRYVRLEDENKIEKESQSLKDKFDEILRPFLTNMMP